MNIEIDAEVIHPGQSLSCDPYLLTPISPKDAPVIFDIRSDPDVMYYLGQEPYKEISEAQAFTNESVQNIEEHSGITWIIRNKVGEGIGYIGFWRIFAHHCRAEIGYAIHPTHQKKGIMSRIMPEVIRFGFDKLRLHSIYADVSTDNEGSIRVLLNNGFKRDGQFRESYLYRGKYIDSVYFSLLESEI